ncbi:hypothetical protein A3D70_00320 [Candidatus Adlerbacteria bacterium RIFCSPHIGHO2_02_FULL_54_18]|uniref:DUF4145 domain-containing protein n=1 Tax=Candidatus Adlerbacteria bacterium RIFCSPHIGHO2_02_FULL_54_18 TaxID=1797241 RepID=A0A1F4Y255_9BACT|nr:MAG: hypothetical protein A3D70_00320 [Candidatus Adlerbacteria bacterium RIFCSPHIGHO2_02_FULL_54_18]
MGSVDFLNVEYLLVRSYEFISGFQSALQNSPDWFGSFVNITIIIGMMLSFFLIALIVYARIMLLQTEHEGFHTMEEREHEHHAAEVESTGKDDRWERIVALASTGSESDWRRAILEADIMLGDVLLAQGYEGASVGEQLKMANPIQMTTLDLAWKAHKVRNDIAHGGESYTLDERDMRTAVDYYKRVFEELGAV